MSLEEPLIALSGITVRIRDRMAFHGTDWEIRPGENWAVLGPNGSGKSSLVRLLVGDIPYSRGTVRRPQDTGYVSFELQDWLLNTEEIRRDERDRKGRARREKGLAALLHGNEGLDPASPFFLETARLVKVEHLLDREIRFLSTGEMRKILITRALLKSPRLLVLDEPLSGIDAGSRIELTEIMDTLASRGTQLVLVTNRPDEVLPCITHVICVKDCGVIFRGTKTEALGKRHIDLLYGSGKPEKARRVKTGEHPHRGRPALIEMKDVRVRYGKATVLEHINWTVRAGDKWAVTEPNGSGKTTLLRLITGENLQGYANDVRIFGEQRGSGEILWELREKIGWVSSEQLISYRKTTKVSDVVASGFFSSIGLYRNISTGQKEKVDRVIDVLGIAHLKDKPFGETSYGEKRLAMIARALVKSPTLLIMDEPCEGLDPANRAMVLGIIDSLCRNTPTTLVYVTHYPDELPDCITHRLELGVKKK